MKYRIKCDKCQEIYAVSKKTFFSAEPETYNYCKPCHKKVMEEFRLSREASMGALIIIDDLIKDDVIREKLYEKILP